MAFLPPAFWLPFSISPALRLPELPPALRLSLNPQFLFILTVIIRGIVPLALLLLLLISLHELLEEFLFVLLGHVPEHLFPVHGAPWPLHGVHHLDRLAT